MRAINIHEAKTHLSRLVDQAANGEPFIIAKAGKPLVKVMPLEAPTGAQIQRLGFMAMRRAATLTPEGRKPLPMAIPDDFDQMGSAEIERLFGGEQ